MVVGDDASERDAGLAVADLHDQSVPGLDQQRQRMVRGDEMRLDPVAHDPQRVLERVLPHALDPAGERIAAPDVVDEHVEAAVLGADPVHQRRDVRRIGVVAADGNPGPACGVDPLGGALDRLRSVHLRALLARGAAAAVDGGSERSELDGDRAAAAAGGAGDKGDPAGKGTCCTHALDYNRPFIYICRRHRDRTRGATSKAGREESRSIVSCVRWAAAAQEIRRAESSCTRTYCSLGSEQYV